VTTDLFLPDPDGPPNNTQGTQPCTPERLLAFLRGYGPSLPVALPRRGIRRRMARRLLPCR
jgi:hypothetical protein